MPAYQMGTVLPDDLAKYIRNGQVRNAAGIAGDNNGMGVNPFAITDYGQLGLCSNSSKTTGAYSAVCLGHDASGNAVLSLTSPSGGPPSQFIVEIDGVKYGLISSGGGNTMSPDHTTVGEIASFNGTVPPTPLRMGAAQITDAKTGAIPSTGATLTGATSNGYSADQILAYTFCTAACLPLPAQGGGNYEGVRGIGISNAGTTVPIVAGVSGYVMANQPFAGSGPSSVALFGTGVAAVDNSSVWGVNTNVSDHQYRVAQPAGSHHRRVVGAEFDVSASYTDTSVTGILVAGNSVVQPANSSAVAVVGQDFSASTPGSIAKWTNAFYSYPGVASHFAFVSAATASQVNSDSQDLLFGAYVASTAFLGQLYFGAASMPNYGSAVQPSFNVNYAWQVKSGGVTSRSTANEIIQLGGHIDLASGATIISRDDAGTVLNPLEILASNLYVNTPIQLKSYTVATLPPCSPTVLTYAIAAVTDATAPTYNGALTGGGAVKIPVFCNGTAWVAH